MAKKTEYIVTVKNTEYDGKAMGIQFNKGKALVSEHTLDSWLGWTLEQVLFALEHDFGYTVEAVKE